jgi:hypothetical protein
MKSFKSLVAYAVASAVVLGMLAGHPLARAGGTASPSAPTAPAPNVVSPLPTITGLSVQIYGTGYNPITAYLRTCFPGTAYSFDFKGAGTLRSKLTVNRNPSAKCNGSDTELTLKTSFAKRDIISLENPIAFAPAATAPTKVSGKCSSAYSAAYSGPNVRSVRFTKVKGATAAQDRCFATGVIHACKDAGKSEICSLRHSYTKEGVDLLSIRQKEDHRTCLSGRGEISFAAEVSCGDPNLRSTFFGNSLYQ